jgi:myosin heavy subunit
VKQLNKMHTKFINDKLHSSTEFGVHHFAGPVIYDASKFVEKNTDKLPDFLMSVVATSTNGLIAQELENAMKQRTTTTKRTHKQSKRTVIDEFQIQLKKLIVSIDNSKSRYIRCIKPCDNLEVTRRIDHQVVLRQLRCSGLVTAIELSRETFPNKLLFAAVARRFSCLLSPKTLIATADMDLHDKAQLILSSVFAPLFEKYQGNTFPTPFACGYTTVFFRAGALETLERQRLEVTNKSAQTIQKFIRRFVQQNRYLRLLNGFVRLQSVFIGRRTLHEYKKTLQFVLKGQACVRSVANRKRFLRIKNNVVFIQRWWVEVRKQLEPKRKREQLKGAAAIVIYRWYYATRLACRLKIQQASARVISVWARARLQRASFVRMKQAAILIVAWNRTLTAVQRFKRLKNASSFVGSYRRLNLDARARKVQELSSVTIQTFFRSKQQAKRYLKIQKAAKGNQQLQQEHLAVLKLQYFVRLKQNTFRADSPCSQIIKSSDSSEGAFSDALNKTAVKTTSASVNSFTDRGNGLVLATSQVVEQDILHKHQIDELKNDIMLLTSEAELHKQEVEAEFEERLAEYEEEVLQLKQMIQTYEEEKVNLKDEIAANVMNVSNLKTGIRSMQEAHREYLNKVMRAIENANNEHQRALEIVKRDGDSRVQVLSNEIERLKNVRTSSQELESNHNQRENMYELARKIEKLTAPNYVTSLTKKMRKLPSKEDYIEEKLSRRVRQLLYRLEDIAATSFHNHFDNDEHVQSLQQQLLEANKEIERHQMFINNSLIHNDQVGRRGIKKFFER